MSQPEFDGKTVLLVDDELQLRALVANFLKRRKFTVLEADGGIKAFEIFQSKPLDLIISDIRMPQGDGLELLKKISESGRAKPPIILTSGQTETSNQEAIDAGAAR